MAESRRWCTLAAKQLVLDSQTLIQYDHSLPLFLSCDSVFLPMQQDELSTQQGYVLWGNRAIVPPSLQEKVSHELHHTQPGISRMKSLARSYLWWPNLDSLRDWTQMCLCVAHASRWDQIHQQFKFILGLFPHCSGLKFMLISLGSWAPGWINFWMYLPCCCRCL